jgi:integrase
LVSGKTTSKTYVVQRDLPGGRTRRVTVAGVNEKTLEEARRLAGDMLADMRRGLDPKAKKETLTLRGVLAAYRAAHSHRLRPQSDYSYRSATDRYLSDWLDRPLPEITRDMVEARHKRIAAEIASRPRRPSSGHAMANSTMRGLRLLWNFAADRNPALGPNPVRLKKLWFTVPRRSRHVRADELPKFYEAIARLENHVQRDYLLLLLFTGLRRREAARLRWEDVDLGERVIRVPEASTKARRKLDLPMTAPVHAMLVARRALGDAKFVFPANSKTGHLAEPKFALRQIEKACGVAVSVHDLRRTYITVAESCDVPTLALKALVNHALRSDVTAGYVQMHVERLRPPAERVAEKLRELCGIAGPSGENVAKLRG